MASITFASDSPKGPYRQQNEVPDAILSSEFTTYDSGVYARYNRASNRKNRAEEMGQDAVYYQCAVELKDLELKVIAGILENHYVANKVDTEIAHYSARIRMNPRPMTYADDRSYVSMLKNAAAQAALIHYLAYTKGYGRNVVLPSADVKRSDKLDIIFSENPGEERPIICRCWPTKTPIYYVECGAIPMFLREEGFAQKSVKYPLTKKDQFDRCRENTQKEPIFVGIPYELLGAFMNRNWDV